MLPECKHPLISSTALRQTYGRQPSAHHMWKSSLARAHPNIYPCVPSLHPRCRDQLCTADGVADLEGDVSDGGGLTFRKQPHLSWTVVVFSVSKAPARLKIILRTRRGHSTEQSRCVALQNGFKLFVLTKDPPLIPNFLIEKTIPVCSFNFDCLAVCPHRIGPLESPSFQKVSRMRNKCC